MHLSNVLFPDPFSPIRPNVDPCRHLERHVVERPELLEAGAASPQDRRLQRLVALVVQAETLRHVVDGDDRGRGHTSSARRGSSLLKTHSPTATEPDRPGDEVQRRRQAREAQVVEHVAEGFDETRDRVQVVQEANRHAHTEDRAVLGNERGRVHDRRRVEERLERDVHEVLDVAEVDVGDAQDQAHAEHRAREQRHQHHRHRDPGQHHVAGDEQDHADHAELDRERDQQRRDRRGDEQLAREVDLLDEVAVRDERLQRQADAAGDVVPGNQAAQQEEHEAVEPARVADRRLDVEEPAEDDRVDQDRRERVEQRPRPAEDRLLVLAAQLSEGQIDEELASTHVLPKRCHSHIKLARSPFRIRPSPPCSVTSLVDTRATLP